MPFKSESQRRKFYAMAARGEISKETVKKWEKHTKKKKLPERVKAMKKGDTVVNNLISRPLDLDQHIQSKLDPDALKFILLLRYHTSSLPVNVPIEIAFDKYLIHIHKLEEGIYSGYLKTSAEQMIVMEFSNQSLPIIGSMLAAKLGDLVPVQSALPEEKSLVEVNEPSSEVNAAQLQPPQEPLEPVPASKGTEIVISPSGEIKITVKKSLPMFLVDKVIELKKSIQTERSKKSRLYRMWKVFHIDMPDALNTEDEINKACSGLINLINKLAKQGKTEDEAAFIAIMAGKDKYGIDILEKSVEGFKSMHMKALLEKLDIILPDDDLEKAYSGLRKIKQQLRARGVNQPAAITAWVGRQKYGDAKFSHMMAARQLGDKMKKALTLEEKINLLLPDTEDLEKAYVGFEKLKQKIAQRGGAKNPAAVAAAIGRRKYGAKRFSQMISAGKPGGKKGKPASGKMRKATMRDIFTPDESIQPNKSAEMHELRKADAEARFSHPQFDEKAEWKGSVRVQSDIAKQVEKLVKANDNAQLEEVKKAQIDKVWENRKKVNYCERDTKTEAEKYWDKDKK